MILLLAMILQNLGNTNIFHLGSYSSQVPSTTILLIIKFIYILFWTWILNLICKDGHPGIAWFLILIPFILFFVLVGLMMI